MSRLHLGPPHVNGAAGEPHAPRSSSKRRAPRPKPTRETQLYAAMVDAVRAWVREVHPNVLALDVCDADPISGINFPIACFHTGTDAYARGDLAALGLAAVPDLRSRG